MANQRPPVPPPADPPPPVSADVRTALAQYEAALSGLRTGVVDLEASPSYLMLTGAGATGETAHRHRSAVEQAANLWPLVNAIDEAIDAARAVESGAGDLNRSERQQELARLVRTRWFPTDGGPPATAGRLLSVGEALDELRRTYDAIRHAVAEVDSVWRDILPRVDGAKATVTRLRLEAERLGVTEPLIGRAERVAGELEAQLLTDPLGIPDDAGSSLDRTVIAAANQMAALRGGHDQLDADLAATEELLASLRVLRARAEAQRAESLGKIVEPDGIVVPPTSEVIDGDGGLAEQLDGLFDQTTTWVQRRTLLDSWLRSARRLRDQLERAEQSNRAPLDRRDELRGRLAAYQAKMAAVGRAEDADLLALSDDARAELYTAPTDLGRAETVIEAMAEELRA